MNPEKCFLICRSVDDEDGPGWLTTMAWPGAVEGNLFNHLRDFFLMVIVIEEGEFRLTAAGRLVATDTYAEFMPKYHRQILTILEENFQDVLSRLMHSEWDTFRLGWQPIGWRQEGETEKTTR